MKLSGAPEIGDLIKHKNGTLVGSGLILDTRGIDLLVLWGTGTDLPPFWLKRRFAEVISESR